MRTKILESILNVVCDVCEVEAKDVLSKNRQEDVYRARCIFIHACKKCGFPMCAVRKFLNRKRVAMLYDYLYYYDATYKQ